ncbi:hypothetical protein Lpl7_0876 [Lacticaseibacillus paracasei subsp. tolerans Lpl7]|uniref:DNA helicase n=1 Tax=Lacticaseibacillus paracasei subsp. tolerans Lpl14 TaxID=1256229 RepID=A0A829GYI7_LACPA|nr:UvrD-helicase domain-containing protein [Lacticaseibacillus paracasei]EPC15060.1 hypothetical protein Lpl7_0876 [Lacticaseibacillus paracasei subsp. tolerans Lpl7]EPC65834.1 hypothetical protein Lpl14_05836 [Lacticaseibacillus paracasei subsp. tolerans Lpl14]
MKLINSGAGSGKTTSLAEVILSRNSKSSVNTHIFVIAYSNYASSVIRTRLTTSKRKTQAQIHISTIHSFLWNFVIEPYYYLLFGTQFTEISSQILGGDQKFRASKLKQLREDHILHVSEFSRIAKKVIIGSKTACKREKAIRAIVLKHLALFVDSIYIDEAQDMDQNTAEIIEVLDSKGIFCYLVGDINQDLHARNGFKYLIKMHKSNSELKTENYRCPRTHVMLSNRYISYNQVSMSTTSGRLGYVLEKDTDVQLLLEEYSKGLIYINKSIRHFNVHSSNSSDSLKRMEYILRKYHTTVADYAESDSEVSKKWAFDIARWVWRSIESGTESQVVVQSLIKLLHQAYSRKLYAELYECINLLQKIKDSTGSMSSVPLCSIEAAKGSQSDRCLLIMSTDLFRVLIGESNKKNSTTNALYVALTRSIDQLLIILTREVTSHYSDRKIEKSMNQLGIFLCRK